MGRQGFGVGIRDFALVDSRYKLPWNPSGRGHHLCHHIPDNHVEWKQLGKREWARDRDGDSAGAGPVWAVAWDETVSAKPGARGMLNWESVFASLC